MQVYGLLITKDDHELIGDWCRDQLRFYEAVVCLDGSESRETERQLRGFGANVIYLREADAGVASKTDHGLRRIVHDELVARFGNGIWIMCCHADEFCYHDPRKIAAKADREGFDLVTWFSPHFYPHPSERDELLERMRRAVQDRFQHYHWGYRGDPFPWAEDRLYRAAPHVFWDNDTHGSVRPHGTYRPAPFHPILRHYKVCSSDLSRFEPSGLYRSHWVEQSPEFRTGLPFRVERLDDLFVTSVPKYSRCTRFEGVFDQPWNMGEEFRSDADESPPQPERTPEHVAPLLPESPSGSSTASSELRNSQTAERVQCAASTPNSESRLSDRRRSVTHARREVFTLRLGGRAIELPLWTRGSVDRAIVHDVLNRQEYGEFDCFQPNVVLDVGAHIGVFSLLARSLWPNARIIACEADPENAELLRQNVGTDNAIEIIEAALVPDELPETTFYSVVDKAGQNSGGGSCVRPEPGSVPIRVSALGIETLWRDRLDTSCDLLKLDCEGSELPLLGKLAETGRLRGITRIVGEWHATDSALASTAGIRRAIQDILSATHSVEFGPIQPGREGHFSARRAR